MAAIWASRMPGAEIAAVISCLVGGQRFLGGQRADPFHGFEADRPHDDQFASHGLEQEFGLGHDLAQFGLDAGGADQFFEVLQPRGALAAECDGVGLPGVQPVDERVWGGMASPGRDYVG